MYKINLWIQKIGHWSQIILLSHKTEFGEMAKSKDVSAEVKANISTHYVVIPDYYIQMWKLDSEAEWGKKWIHLTYDVGGESYRYTEPPERQTCGSSCILSLKHRWK